MRSGKNACFTLLAAAAFLFLCAACSNTFNALPDGAMIEGETLIIELEENPTTGFSWIFEYDPTVLELIDDEYQPDRAETAISGSGGIHHYEFKGLSEGETTLTFKYLKSWEGEESAEDTKTFEVDVNQAGKIESVE